MMCQKRHRTARRGVRWPRVEWPERGRVLTFDIYLQSDCMPWEQRNVQQPAAAWESRSSVAAPPKHLSQILNTRVCEKV
jgi:hypothetical protein